MNLSIQMVEKGVSSLGSRALEGLGLRGLLTVIIIGFIVYGLEG